MHFYILTIDSEKEIKETIPFTVTSKRIKYLVIKLSKEAKDLHTEKCKMLIKEIEDDRNRWKDIFSYLFLDGSILLKWTYYPKESTDLI